MESLSLTAEWAGGRSGSCVTDEVVCVTDSENQVYQSVKHWHRIENALVGDRIEESTKKLGHGIWRSQKKQICDFWIFGAGVFCGLEVKETYGDGFDTTQNPSTKYQLMNLRKIERHGGRGYFLLQFVSGAGAEWYAVRVKWLDEYMTLNKRQQVRQSDLAEAAVGGTSATVQALKAFRVPRGRCELLDLSMLISKEAVV